MSDYGEAIENKNFVAGWKYCDDVPNRCDCGKEKKEDTSTPELKNEERKGHDQYNTIHRIVGGTEVHVS